MAVLELRKKAETPATPPQKIFLDLSHVPLIPITALSDANRRQSDLLHLRPQPTLRSANSNRRCVQRAATNYLDANYQATPTDVSLTPPRSCRNAY